MSRKFANVMSSKDHLDVETSTRQSQHVESLQLRSSPSDQCVGRQLGVSPTLVLGLLIGLLHQVHDEILNHLRSASTIVLKAKKNQLAVELLTLDLQAALAWVGFLASATSTAKEVAGNWCQSICRVLHRPDHLPNLVDHPLK